MQALAIIAVALAVIVGVNVWASIKDDERNVAATNYENCVQAQYHMTPSEWYAEHNEYPLCGN